MCYIIPERAEQLGLDRLIYRKSVTKYCPVCDTDRLFVWHNDAETRVCLKCNCSNV